MRYRSARSTASHRWWTAKRSRALEVLSDQLFTGRPAEVRSPNRKELAAPLGLRVTLDVA
jgi:hypothetical protein